MAHPKKKSSLFHYEHAGFSATELPSGLVEIKGLDLNMEITCKRDPQITRSRFTQELMWIVDTLSVK